MLIALSVFTGNIAGTIFENDRYYINVFYYWWSYILGWVGVVLLFVGAAVFGTQSIAIHEAKRSNLEESRPLIVQ